MKYYVVTCMRGHCGTGNGTEIKFAIKANNLLEACNIAKRMPAVKHSRPVLFGKEITQEEYNKYRQKSAYKRFS